MQARPLQQRMDNPAFVVPGAMAALQALAKAVHDCGLAPTTLELVHLRASQLNGCSVCVYGHAHALRKAGEPDERIDTVGAWREAPYFSDAERAALSLAESVTRLSDRSNPVPDDVWAEAARHYDEQQLAALVLAIASINVWNRLNAATHQVAGATW